MACYVLWMWLVCISIFRITKNCLLSEKDIERDKKDVSTNTLVVLAKLVLKNNIFNFNKKTLKQKRGTTIGTKVAPPNSILFMVELEEKILEIVDNKPCL